MLYGNVAYALQSADSEAEFEVQSYGGSAGSLVRIVDADIADWVVQIGPQTYMDDALCAPCYQYSVVSNDNGHTLFVLARDPAIFVNEYNLTVYERLIEQGFTHPLNRPIVSVLGNLPLVILAGDISER